MPPYDYDLFVIGSGPGGVSAAIQAGRLNKRVAIAERRTTIGGASINTGTIPSKTLREAVLHLSGYQLRGIYGASYAVKQNITIHDLLLRTDHVIRHEIDVTRLQLTRHNVELIAAEASFIDSHTLRLKYVGAQGHRDITAENIVIATGSYPARETTIPFDGQRIFVSADILTLNQSPRTLSIVGAGVIGCEYASIFAALGVRVTLVDMRPHLLPFIDSEIAESLAYQMRENNVTLRLGEQVSALVPIDDGPHSRVKVSLASGKQIITDKALYAVGRIGATSKLNLPGAGLSADDRGRVKVNDQYQTDVPHIYAVGDLIGFPSLASISMEQGRLAASNAFGVKAHSVPDLFPYGIYTIPEISTVGYNEEELTKQGIPYEVGKAHYREIARGQIIGDETGLLKLIFHRELRTLLGIHVIGAQASELIHIGQAVMAFAGEIDYFVDTVFNYPTLAECYKIAAFDGLSRLGV